MTPKKIISLLLVTALILTFAGCSKKKSKSGESELTTLPAENLLSPADTSEMDFTFSDRDKDASYGALTASIAFSNSGSKVSGSGASANGASVTVSAEGTYLISGAASNARLTVDAPKEDKIQLVLDGLSLTSDDGPAIYIKSADKVFITLKGGTENSLSDAEGYELSDDETTLDAALFSKEDLTINGSGELEIKGNYKHGIVSKDDLVITGGAISVEAKNVGLCGKDCVKISGADITVSAGSDAIRSNNEEDSNRGYIYVEDGSLDLTAENDGMQAATVIKINGGDITVLCGGGSVNASTTQGGDWNRNWAPGRPPQMQGSAASGTSNEESAKGLKAGSDMIINGGSFSIDSADDSVHSNSNIMINGGSFDIRSGDDGMHADTSLAISGGKITVTKSYEGLEATNVMISGGDIDVTASDDGINAAGGNDGSAMGGRPGQGNFSATNGSIAISGGYILVDAKGDGIDSNGTIDISGGVTLISGPTDNGNCAFDHDGTATVSGGVLIAVGSSGMAETFNSAVNQGALYVSFATQSAGTSISLCDNDGNVVVGFTPAKQYQSAVITAPGLQVGNKYSIVSGAAISGTDSNGYAESTTASGGTTLVNLEMTSSLYGSSGGGMGGGPGGMRPR